MEDIKNFIAENRSYCVAFVVLVIVCITGVWLVHDYHRNDPVYNNTDDAMEHLEKRIGTLEQRITDLSGQLAKAEKTVQRISDTITAGRKNAESVASGIDGIEKQLDTAIQRQGRITNIVAEIERINK